ncbi:hypothetical protein AB0C51_06240 [Streptomyces pathocidini]|uniref:hypothetical protein n=1 Tax=Streptomyces pathocidini TaxID=1650571 RepID=UPI0033DEAF37
MAVAAAALCSAGALTAAHAGEYDPGSRGASTAAGGREPLVGPSILPSRFTPPGAGTAKRDEGSTLPRGESSVGAGHSASARPQPYRSEPGSPETRRPEQSRPEQSRPELGRPEQSRPELSRPELGRPEAGRSEPGTSAHQSGHPNTPDTSAGSADPLKVTPGTGAPGSEVEIRVKGCEGGRDVKVLARSEAFVAPAELAPESGGGYFGEARIRSTAQPGTYRITTDCRVVGTLTVAAGASGAHPSGSPTAPVRAGGGGTAVLAAQTAEAAEEDGPGLAHFVVAAGLVGGAGLAVAGIALRRRRADSAGS